LYPLACTLLLYAHSNSRGDWPESFVQVRPFYAAGLTFHVVFAGINACFL
jgi:hypothetical protein